ncbi:MAG: tripartite tricarboxylate transporter substrate-binding protein [Betaproteobacteria bacterium]|jgi:tripartite-type tricarboxylate transporter receptor subunit TctC|nr:tripartite tricarboxylate transporter substrate-binding protein [Betaproteobacteria bacterium]MDH5287333.1 tripartite tricarboxylate transporter substrate-binding protein [Betaproteobacteria bacterium]
MKRTLVAAAALFFAAGAFAQAFPTKPISLYVPFAAGGPTDTVARQLAIAMGKAIGQTIIVENVPGAGGTIAPAKLKGQTPDGHTLMLAHIGMSTAPALYRSLPFKPLDDFEYIGQVVDVPMTFVARKDFPPTDFKGMVDYVKKNKDKVTYANAGLGAASHLCGLLFLSAIEADVTTVPYKGTAPAMNDILGGQVDFMCDQTTNTTGYIKSGRIKSYAVTSKTRVESLKELPPAAEAGLPGFEVSVWHGVYAPKGTPKPVIDKLVAALQASIADAQFVAKMNELGSQVVSKDKATPEGLRNHLKAEIDKWTPIIRKAGQYAD